ncbi:MAG: hypothetical protein GX359_05360 [Clostridiales bacterium]|nr:hypothetical protein [Clostridiales bacterium]
MPIRPVEIIQSQGASQFKHIESQRTIHQQVHNSNNFQNLIKQESAKTKESTKSENNEYRYDAKEKGNNQYYGSGNRKKKNKNGSKQEKKSPSKRSGGIDILI